MSNLVHGKERRYAKPEEGANKVVCGNSGKLTFNDKLGNIIGAETIKRASGS